jgi:hypothetical protein
MGADEEVDRLPGGRYFQPLADLMIGYPPEATNGSWSKVAAVVEVEGLLAALDAQALQCIERPHREREAP